MEITDKINEMKTIYHKIYQQQTDDIESFGDSLFQDCPEIIRGHYNGGFMKYEQDGYYYYLYEKLAFTSLLKRKVKIDDDLYLNNAYAINNGTYNHLDDDTEDELLKHNIDYFSYYEYKKKFYHCYDCSIIET